MFSHFGGRSLDAKKSSLEIKFQNLRKQASSVATQIQAIGQMHLIPQFDQIEMLAHNLRKQFSRMIQSERARHLAATNLNDVRCLHGRQCQVRTMKREVHSMDGPIKISETDAAKT